MRIRLQLVLPLLLLAACARAPLKGPENSMRRSNAPELSDDLPIGPLLDSVEAQIRHLESTPGRDIFIFGQKNFSKAEYLAGLRRFVELGRSNSDSQAFFSAVRNEFEFYEVYGKDRWGEAFITSYYEPLIEGSLKPTARFSQPVYSTPSDLVSLDLSEFNAKFAQERKLRGRLNGGKLVPYFTREEIDSQMALKGRKLEICYLDPIDAFFLQIQGSGTVDLGGGKLIRLNYAEKNGHVYEQLAAHLRGKIPPEQMNLHTIEDHLRSLSREELQRILNLNPSYVFFKIKEESALTFLGVPATDGRTIATDPRFFPKGALAFINFEKPRFGEGSKVPVGADPASRFVLDQDIGGAITGGGRLDLFWGRGAEAKLYAGAMKNPGRLYYLAPKAK